MSGDALSFEEFWNSQQKKPKGIGFTKGEMKSPECVDFKYLRRARKLVRDYRDILNQNLSDKKWRLGSERLYRGSGAYVLVYNLVIKEGRTVLDRKVIEFMAPSLIPKQE